MFTVKGVPRALVELKSRMLAGTGTRNDLSGQDMPVGSQEEKARPSTHVERIEGKLEVLRIKTRRLDGSTCLALRPQLSAVWKRGVTTVIIDMSEVVFLDSLGISALISEQRRRPPGTRIVVSSLCDFVRDVFEVTQLFEVFDVFSDSDAAVAALAA